MSEEKTSKKAYTFSDVLIVPKYSEIESRRNVNISSDFGSFRLELPIIAANMKTICGPQMAIAMSLSGGMGILHRFCSIDQAAQDFLSVSSFFKNEIQNRIACSGENSTVYFQSENKTSGTFSGSMYSTVFGGEKEKNVIKKDYVVGVSIGVQEEDKERFDKLYEVGAKIFCIDIAHGHSLVMKNMLKWIKAKNIKDICIMAGNIATSDGALSLVEWGADFVKAGIGPGAACLTRKNVGVGVPQLYALECVREGFEKQGINHVKIIADGGMSTIGDISKALKYAHAVMLGAMISGTTETPGSVFTNDKGEFYKVYAGSASLENKTSYGNANEFIEGVSKTVSFRGHVSHILRHIKEGVQSAFSYTNSNSLSEFQKNCEFVEMTAGGKTESKI